MDRELIVCDEGMIEDVIGCAIEVHRILGPGLLESPYELALMYELSNKGLKSQRQVEIPVNYKNENLGTGFRADVVVDNKLLIELKAVDVINKIHVAQVITYLKLLNMKRGLIINFNTSLLKNGIKRISI